MQCGHDVAIRRLRGRAVRVVAASLQSRTPFSGLPELEAVSDAAGRLRFGDVPPGTYRVSEPFLLDLPDDDADKFTSLWRC